MEAALRSRRAKWHALAALHDDQRTGIKPRRKMPKLKTKSGAKKRFKITATGKVKAGVAGKRHRLLSHNSKYIRTQRGTKVMSDPDAKIIKGWMPYG